MSEPIGIEIRNLYKIFGPNPQAHVEAVKNGLTKRELNETHRHVLGLRDINIRVAAASIQVVMGLSGFEKSYPSQLSGGMQQRVGLARALANDAPILLMDEAYSALDPLIRYDMQTVLLDLQKEVRKTIVFITHDLDEALRIGDRIALLRDGSVIQQGSGQEIVLAPADDYVANFVQHVDRGKIVKVASVMEPAGPDATEGRIGAEATLSQALRQMASSGARCLGVADEGGPPLGILTLERAISAYAG